MSGTTTSATEVVNNRWRCERKFLPGPLTLTSLLSIVRRHPAAFREVYPERTVNNLYLDTPTLDNYYQHVEGVCARQKARIRWYGKIEPIIANPVLEFKIKEGSAGTKTSYPLPALATNGNMVQAYSSWRDQNQAGFRPEVRFPLISLRPTLINRYRRLYYFSANTGVRLTLDFELSYSDPQNPRLALPAQVARVSDLVLELKYPFIRADEASSIAAKFPFRCRRCSKYVTGMALMGW
jgi:hypothetical protein